MAPCKALKVSTSSATRWVVEAQATIQRGAASARADPKEPVAPEGAGFAGGTGATKQQELEDEVEDAAKRLAEDIDLFGEVDEESQT